MPKRQPEPSLLDPADDLAQVIGPDLAKHFLDHRKALKKPMTPFAASLMAKKLRTFPDPVAAVEQSILKGWQDVFPVEPHSTQYVQKVHTPRQTMANIFNDMEDFFGEPGSDRGAQPPAQGTLLSLPFDGRKH